MIVFVQFYLEHQVTEKSLNINQMPKDIHNNIIIN